MGLEQLFVIICGREEEEEGKKNTSRNIPALTFIPLV